MSSKRRGLTKDNVRSGIPVNFTRQSIYKDTSSETTALGHLAVEKHRHMNHRITKYSFLYTSHEHTATGDVSTKGDI